MNRLVNFVAFEREHDGGVSGRRGERFRIELLVTLVDGLAQRDSGERDELRIDRRIHQHDPAGTRCE